MESFTQKEIVSQSTKHVNWLDNIPELCYCVFQLRWAGLYMYFLSLDWNMRLCPFVHFFAYVFCNFKFCMTQINKWTCQLLSVLQFASIGSKPLQLQLLFGPYRSSMECFNFCYFVKLKNRQKKFIFKWCI